MIRAPCPGSRRSRPRSVKSRDFQPFLPRGLRFLSRQVTVSQPLRSRFGPLPMNETSSTSDVSHVLRWPMGSFLLSYQILKLRSCPEEQYNSDEVVLKRSRFGTKTAVFYTKRLKGTTFCRTWMRPVASRTESFFVTPPAYVMILQRRKQGEDALVFARSSC